MTRKASKQRQSAVRGRQNAGAERERRNKVQNKFTEEFEAVTNGAFPMLKFKSAAFQKDIGTLTVRFLISAYSARAFDADMKKRVDDALAGIFPGIPVHAEYIRTYADDGTVRNKVSEYFNAHNNLVFRALSSETLLISVSETDISVTLALESALFLMLQGSDIPKDLAAFLDNNFNQRVSVNLKDTGATPAPAFDDFSDTVVVRDPSTRLISAETGDKVYARGKIAGIAKMPAYIGDVKGAADNLVLCGRITGVTKRTYKNKKYTPDDPKNGPEELPLVRFFLDDTTGRMDCVCFPRPEDADAFDALAEKDEVICAGKVTISSYNGAPSFAVNAVFRAKIDFSSVQAAPSKPVPARYTVLKPQPFKDERGKKDLFESDGEKKTPEFLRGKTFVVFDFEATGLDIATIEPIEIGAAKIVDGRITETFTSLLDPKCHIPDEVAEKTSINDAMVHGMPTFAEVLPDFFKFTRGAVLVGHNISSYDFPLLNKYASAAGYVFDNELEDTIILARKYIPEARHVGLEALTKMFGITHINAHRAMGDVFATAELLNIIAERI